MNVKISIQFYILMNPRHMIKEVDNNHAYTIPKNTMMIKTHELIY